MSINVPMKKACCGVCNKAFESDIQAPFVRVKGCGDLYHKDCLFDENRAHVIVEGTAMRILCPSGCQGELIRAEKNVAFSELAKKVESIDFSRAKAESGKGIRYASYLAVVFVVVAVALVIHTSLLSVGIGLIVSIPIAWLVGKGIKRALAPHPSRLVRRGGVHG